MKNFTQLQRSATKALEARREDVRRNWRASDGGLTWAAGDEISNCSRAIREIEEADCSATVHRIMGDFHLKY